MVKNSIALMADSTCDIPEDLIEQYGITIIPELVIWGDKTFRDRVDITPQEFYERIEKDPVRPTTTLPSPARIREVYQGRHFARGEGKSSYLPLEPTAAMSGYLPAANSRRSRK